MGYGGILLEFLDTSTKMMYKLCEVFNVSKVILISIDGMRADSVNVCKNSYAVKSLTLIQSLKMQAF